MASQVRLVVLASSLNLELQGSPAGLINIYGSCAINYLMAQVKSVTRLQPMSEKVFLVTNDDHHSSFTEWACTPELSLYGAPATSNIISNGCSASGSTTSSAMKDVLLAVETAGLSDCHLVVVNADQLLDPYFSLQKFIEHSIVRGKDTVAFTRPPPGAELSGFTNLELDPTPGNINPRVLGVSCSSTGQADGLTASVLAPLVILRRDTVPEIRRLAESSDHLGAFVGELVASGRPVHGLELDVFLDLTTPASAAYADSFIAYCADSKIGTSNEASDAIYANIESLTKAGVDMGVLARGEKNIEDLLQSCSEVKLAYLYYFAADGDSSRLGVVDSSAGTRELPARFADMGTRRHDAKYQHPMYQTTSNDYGHKKPLQAHAPDSYHGSNQFFSKTFLGGNTKISTMRTAVTYSKVHKALDDF